MNLRPVSLTLTHDDLTDLLGIVEDTRDAVQAAHDDARAKATALDTAARYTDGARVWQTVDDYAARLDDLDRARTLLSDAVREA